MLRLPTEAALERELPKLGLNLGERLYGEEIWHKARMEDLLLGTSVESLRMEYIDVLQKLKRTGMTIDEAMTRLPEEDSDRLAESILRYFFQITDTQRFGSNKEDIVLFERSTYSAKDRRRGTGVVYVARPNDECYKRYGKSLKYGERIEDIIRERDALLNCEGVILKLLREDEDSDILIISMINKYPEKIFEVIPPDIDEPVLVSCNLSAHCERAKALHKRPYDPNIAVGLLAEIIKGIQYLGNGEMQ